MASRKRRKFSKVKVVKALSRKEFGRPGKGRKTTFVDRKKKADRDACRKPTHRTEE